MLDGRRGTLDEDGLVFVVVGEEVGLVEGNAQVSDLHCIII